MRCTLYSVLSGMPLEKNACKHGTNARYRGTLVCELRGDVSSGSVV